jgi:transcriptional regulator with XRE-family HTH domain
VIEKSEKYLPNEKLSQARKLRGWSQGELAKRIGANQKNVSRWERGSTAVSPHYQEKLCALFKMSAIELGFLTSNSTSAQEEVSPDSEDQKSAQEELPPDGEDQRTDDRELPPSLLDQLQSLFTQLMKKNHQISLARDKLEDAYQKLLTIAQARLAFAGTIEVLRKYNSKFTYERLPQEKARLDAAEQDFDEDEVWRTLALLDNNKVWVHYVKGTSKFQEYKKRTQDLIEHAMKPPSLLSVPVLKIDAMLRGNAAKDDDPVIRKIYKEIENEYNAMLKAMNKRLRL